MSECCFALVIKSSLNILWYVCVCVSLSVSRVLWRCIRRWYCCTWRRAGGRSTRTAPTWSRGRSSVQQSSPHWEQSGSRDSCSNKKVIFSHVIHEYKVGPPEPKSEMTMHEIISPETVATVFTKLSESHCNLQSHSLLLQLLTSGLTSAQCLHVGPGMLKSFLCAPATPSCS